MTTVVEPPQLSDPAKKWRRRCRWVLAAWILSTVLLSFNSIRGVVAYPLVVNDAKPQADAAYVMADGYAYLERLRMASDLYHMHHVPRILLLNEQDSAGYNFTMHRSQSRVERAIDYLVLHGVPKDKIDTVNVTQPVTFGSLSEARAVASQMPDLKSVVVVTSAPHTRRSRLCFRRSLPDTVQVQVVAATEVSSSAEITAPIWIEYVKLLVYYVVA